MSGRAVVVVSDRICLFAGALRSDRRRREQRRRREPLPAASSRGRRLGRAALAIMVQSGAWNLERTGHGGLPCSGMPDPRVKPRPSEAVGPALEAGNRRTHRLLLCPDPLGRCDGRR